MLRAGAFGSDCGADGKLNDDRGMLRQQQSGVATLGTDAGQGMYLSYHVRSFELCDQIPTQKYLN